MVGMLDKVKGFVEGIAGTGRNWSFKNSFVAAEAGTVNSSPTFDLALSPTFNYQTVSGVTVGGNIQLVEVYPSATPYNPDLKSPLVAKNDKVENKCYINKAKFFVEGSSSVKIPAELNELFKRQELLWKTLHLPSAKEIFSGSELSFEEYKQKWPIIIRAVALAYLISNGDPLATLYRDSDGIISRIESVFAQQHPGKNLVQNSASFVDGFDEILFVTEVLNELKNTDALNAYKTNFALFRKLYYLYLNGEINDGDDILALAQSGNFARLEPMINGKWDRFAPEYKEGLDGKITEASGTTLKEMEEERHFLFNEQKNLSAARKFAFEAGLIDSLSHQASDEFGDRFRNIIMDEPRMNGNSDYGLGIQLSGDYAFGRLRRYLEIGGRLALNLPGRLWFDGDDDYIDPKFGILNMDTHLKFWPHKNLEVSIIGGLSEGFYSEDVKDSSSYWAVMQLKIMALDKAHSAISFVPAGVIGVDNSQFGWMTGLDVFIDFRRGYDAYDVQLIIYTSFHQRNKGTIEDKPVQIETKSGNNPAQAEEDDKVYTKFPGPSPLAEKNPEIANPGTDIMPTIVSIPQKEAAMVLGAKIALKKIYGLPLDTELNFGLHKAGTGRDADPTNGEWGGYVICSVIGSF